MAVTYSEILREQVAALEAERVALVAELDTLTPDEERTAAEVEARASEITARGKEILADIEAKIARADELDKLRQERIQSPKGPEFARKPDTFDVMQDRGATPQQLADALTRAVEPRVDDPANMAHFRKLVNRHRSDKEWARQLILRASDVYESGWSKMIFGRGWELTAEERTALSTVTDANGNYLVPTHLDPTVILSNSGTSNAVRAISRVVTLTRPGDTSWQGITSAGVTASFDAQLAEVSDDSPTFTQPTVPVHKAQALVQASIEAAEDIPGLAGEILMMFADAKDRLEGTAHCTGTGSNQPTGIFTALDANTNVEIASDTAAVISKEDLDEMYYSVPVRSRPRASWLLHPRWNIEIQNLGTAVSNKYSTDLTQSPTQFILGRPVVESDDAPTTTTTTALDNRIVFGDFSNYVIADKVGSFAVEYIPHLFATNANLPSGTRAWYAYWRTGADSVVDTAFRLLQDKTSA